MAIDITTKLPEGSPLSIIIEVLKKLPKNG